MPLVAPSGRPFTCKLLPFSRQPSLVTAKPALLVYVLRAHCRQPRRSSASSRKEYYRPDRPRSRRGSSSRPSRPRRWPREVDLQQDEHGFYLSSADMRGDQKIAACPCPREKPFLL